MPACKKCNGRLILASQEATSFQPDCEPSESGVREQLDDIDAYVVVCITVCEDCREIDSAWIEEPRRGGEPGERSGRVKERDDPYSRCKKTR